MYKKVTHTLFISALLLWCVKAYPKTNIPEKNKQALADSAKFYNTKGLEYWRAGDFDRSEEFLKKSLAIKLTIFNKDCVKLASTYNNLGILNKQYGKYEEALAQYSKSEKIYIKNYGAEYKYIAYIYSNKANIYKTNGDFEKALLFYKKSLAILKKISKKCPRQLSIVYNNIGNLFWETNKYIEAIDYYEKSIALCNKHNQKFLPQVYSNLARNYKKLNNPNKSTFYFQSAINSVELYCNKNLPLLADIYLNYGLFHFEQGEKNKALDLYNKAYNIYINCYGLKHPYTSLNLTYIGDIYFKQGDLQKALEYYQQSLIAVCDNFNDTNIYASPEPKDALSEVYLLETLKKKAFAFQKQYQTTQNLKDLKAGICNANCCIELIENIRNSYLNEESKLILTENQDETFHQAIDIAIELYKVTQDSNYLNLAFGYTEKNKAANLLASLKDVEAKKVEGIPIEMRKKEESLKREIALYKEFIYEEKRQDNTDSEKIQLWENKLFTLSCKYDSLVASLEKEYPRYYALKYDKSIISPKTISNTLKNKETLIEYAFSDTILHIFTINNSLFTVFSQPIDSNFHINLKIVRSYLTNNRFSSHTSHDFKMFTTALYDLYSILIKPVSNNIKGNCLTIIPDDKLAYLPFDILLTEKINTAEMDYRNLPYLIKQYTTGYSYSSTLLYSEKKRDRGLVNKLLAFAPTYEHPGKTTDEPFYTTRQHYRDKLFPIPGVKKEVKNIAKITGGKMLLDTEATEINFKKHSVTYDILHLAMHTLIDDANPMFSKLAFAQIKDSTEDGFLNTHEIYNISLQAKLAVLSSCNSGNGVLQKGEGVMSLARGFIYSGCPSIVMTLWALEDKTSVDLMSDFYKYLMSGNTKADALRRAKLNFLNNADKLKAHPYFWASYVSIGDNNPIYTNKNNLLFVFVFLGVLALGFFIFRIRTLNLR